ncbi:hypothetical protein TNCV_3832261 [Trichonephila clavipes]|nr:hypothetical protein TNCV_3832261 [Trichonephila clavipes]
MAMPARQRQKSGRHFPNHLFVAVCFGELVPRVSGRPPEGSGRRSITISLDVVRQRLARMASFWRRDSFLKIANGIF